MNVKYHNLAGMPNSAKRKRPMNVARILATKGRNIITIRPEQSIREAIALLAKHNIGVLVTVDETERPIGVISERDIIRAKGTSNASTGH
jgi:CBS domain-containing protein